MKMKVWMHTEIDVDHGGPDGGMVMVTWPNGEVALTPAEAKSLSASILHYAERAQDSRLKAEEGENE